MKPQYTPGPWEINTVEADDDGDLCLMVWGDTQAVCALIVDDDEGWDRETAEANARLIAAAPELLEACKAAKEYCGKPFNEINGADAERVYKLCAEAIAAAEGN